MADVKANLDMLEDVSRLKKLATLNVYLDNNADGSNGIVSGFQVNLPVAGEWAIVLRPKADLANLGNRPKDHKPTIKEAVTIFCHELGHFVSHLFRHPSHHPLLEAIGIVTPAEREAWRIAKMINPDLNPQMMDEALATYKEFSEPHEQRLMAMLPADMRDDLKQKLNF